MDWLDQHSLMSVLVACFQWVKNTCHFRSEICKMFLCKCFNVIVAVSHFIRSLIFFVVRVLACCIFINTYATYGAFTLFRWVLGKLAQISVSLWKQIPLNLQRASSKLKCVHLPRKLDLLMT